MCVVCYVDEVMRSKIIAYNAEFHKVSKSPFGKDDEIGMLNLIDGKSRSAILSRADASKVFDLSVDHFVGMPGWFGAGDPPYQIAMTHTPGGEIVGNSMGVSLAANQLVGYSGDAVSMYTHCGTHIDTFNHFGYGDRIFNDFSTTKNLGSRVWDKCGAEKHPQIDRQHAMAFAPSSHRDFDLAWKHRPPKRSHSSAPQSKRCLCGAWMTKFGNSNKATLFRAASGRRHADSEWNEVARCAIRIVTKFLASCGR